MFHFFFGFMKTRCSFHFRVALRVLVVVVCGAFSSLRAQTAGEEVGMASPVIASEALSSDASHNASHNLVSLDVLRFFSFYNLSYTRVFTPAVSLMAHLETPTNFLNFLSPTRTEGYGARLEARYNFSQKNLVGVYAGPVVGFNSIQTISPIFGSEPYMTTMITAVGAMLGYQISPFSNVPALMFGLALGAEYNFVSVKRNPLVPPPIFGAPQNGVAARLRFSFGYAF